MCKNFIIFVKSKKTFFYAILHTGFEFTHTSGDDQYDAIGLRSTGNHVLDEISVAGGINNGDLVFGGLEFPEILLFSSSSLHLSHLF